MRELSYIPDVLIRVSTVLELLTITCMGLCASTTLLPEHSGPINPRVVLAGGLSAVRSRFLSNRAQMRESLVDLDQSKWQRVDNWPC